MVLIQCGGVVTHWTTDSKVKNLKPSTGKLLMDLPTEGITLNKNVIKIIFSQIAVNVQCADGGTVVV